MEAPTRAAETSAIPATAEAATSERGESLFRYGCFALIAAGLLINFTYIAYNCPLDLSGDEAHYWDWSRHLDISYYSKGPLVAYVIAGGRALADSLLGGLDLPPAAVVRLPAVLLGALTSLGLIVLGRDMGLSWRGVLLALAICASVPMFTVGAVLMTIDAPFLCAWIWAHALIAKTLKRERTWGWWFAAGIVVAIGILAKYTMVLIYAVIGVSILLRPDLRKRLLTKASVAGGLLGLVGFVPIAIWNARHGWVSIRHVAGQAGVSGGGGFNIGGPIEYITSQLGVGNPVWVILIVLLLVQAVRSRRHRKASANGARALLTISTIVVFAVFFAFSFFTKIQPNWPAPALMTGAVLIAAWAMHGDRTALVQQRLNRVLACGIVLGLAIAGLGRRSDVLAPLLGRLTANAPAWELTPAAKYDPAARLRGWHELGTAVGEVVRAQSADDAAPIVLADDYQVSSELAFYTPGQPKVYCVQSALGERLNQYDFWTNPIDEPTKFAGRPCIYVGTLPSESSDKGRRLREAMPGLHPLRTVTHSVRGVPFQVWTIFVADGYRGMKRPTTAAAVHY